MKNNLFMRMLGLLSISVCFSCSNFQHHNIHIKVSETNVEYRFAAHYNEAKTQTLQRYINECIHPGRLEGDYINVTTTLDDKTTFYMKSTPGNLLIKLDKRENSEASYRRIKKIGEGIKEVLKDEH